MEDDRVGILEQQLAQAKLIAEEADKKYEEVANFFHHFTSNNTQNGMCTCVVVQDRDTSTLG